jgi:hypothetical protein
LVSCTPLPSLLLLLWCSGALHSFSTFIPCLHPILCSQFPFKVTYSLVSKKSEERLWKMESKILNLYGEWSWFCERKLFLEILSKRVSLVDFFACV